MERIEYDPEIDPSIREEREAAEKEHELSARIRLEIERYVEENDLVPRGEAQAQTGPPWDGESEDARPKSRRTLAREAKEASRREKDEVKQAKREQRAAGAAQRRKAVQSVFTGSILSSERMRKMWPYLLGLAAVLMLYIAYTFHVQSLHLELRSLEQEIRELNIRSVERTADRVGATSRSAIVERLRKHNIELEEFPHPVKRIER